MKTPKQFREAFLEQLNVDTWTPEDHVFSVIMDTPGVFPTPPPQLRAAVRYLKSQGKIVIHSPIHSDGLVRWKLAPNVDNDIRRASDPTTSVDVLSELAIHSDERVRVAAKATRRNKQIRELGLTKSYPLMIITTWSDVPSLPGWYVVKKRGLASPCVLKWTGTDKGSWSRVTACFGPIPDHK